jgi:hypothetical protein
LINNLNRLSKPYLIQNGIIYFKKHYFYFFFFELSKCSCSANGDMLPFYILFKGKHLWDTWLNNGPEGCAYNVSESGWMESEQFLEWFNTVFVRHCNKIEGPKLLIMDNHGSHISLDIIDKAREHNIHILALPAHSSHLTQPLDVGVFKHVKSAWKEVVEVFFRESGFKNVEKNVFASLFAKIKFSGKAFLRRHVVAGFEQTGIFPFNREAIDSNKLKPSCAFSFDSAQSNDENVPVAIQSKRSNGGSKAAHSSLSQGPTRVAHGGGSKAAHSSLSQGPTRVAHGGGSKAAHSNSLEDLLLELEKDEEAMDSEDSFTSDSSTDVSLMELGEGDDSLMEELKSKKLESNVVFKFCS